VSTFWITNPNNHFVDNVAAGSDQIGFWVALPVNAIGQFIGTEVGTDFRSGSNAGYVIVKIISSKPAESIPPAQRDAQARAITQQAAAAAEFTYAEGLKARHNVKILRTDLQRKTDEKPSAKSEASDTKSVDAKSGSNK